jgi:hypothetical protein
VLSLGVKVLSEKRSHDHSGGCKIKLKLVPSPLPLAIKGMGSSTEAPIRIISRPEGEPVQI